MKTIKFADGGHEAQERISEMEERVSSSSVRTPVDLLHAAQTFADELAAIPNLGDTGAPLLEIEQLAQLGLLMAPLTVDQGGAGLGTEPGGFRPLLYVLAAIGGGDLALGRLYEGHVNALILIDHYGTEDQRRRAANDAREGMLFGVWNTGERDLLQLEVAERLTFRGTKTFASGAAFVMRPIVTAQLESGGWQMTMPRMESAGFAGVVVLDKSCWHPLGMEASGSYRVDFTGAVLERDDLLGGPEDFYQDPLFRGGAIRFAAVQAGSLERLHRMFAEWLDRTKRADDPYQIARLGEIAIGAQEAILWIEHAATIAEESLLEDGDLRGCERMVACANMTRLAIERIATAMMPRIIAGIGAHGLLQPSRFERVLRDLTMYLRQPSPDQTLADVGRSSLKQLMSRDKQKEEPSSAPVGDGSLQPAYFDTIYEQSSDPWDFETSPYEKAKYADTLSSLPRNRYRRALEIGCSIGVLTKDLAKHCDALVSIDVSDRALGIARERCKALPQVQFACMQAPRAMPEGDFDLIVISEVAYYWDLLELREAARTLAKCQKAGDHLILVHYTPFVPDYPLTGDEVHEAWIANPEWKVVEERRSERYRLNVFERI